MLIQSVMKNPVKRSNILASAIRVFARQGYYNTTVAMIARGAEVADGTIYLYFNSKEDILISIFEESIERVIKTQLRALRRADTFAEKLRTFAMVHLQLIRDHPDLAQLLQVELRQSSKFMKNYQPESFLRYLNIIGDIFAAGRESGEFRREIRVSVAKLAFFGALDEFSTQWIFQPPQRLGIEEAAERISAMFLNGVMQV
jgi:TetR/AcrR family fatty acid metabolism transcriptional regulator